MKLTVKPRAAASIVVIDRHDRVLLVERGKGAPPGMWSLPGGHIEPGEKAEAAAVREVFEETSIKAVSHGLIDVQDVMIRDKTGALVAQYLLAVFCGTCQRSPDEGVQTSEEPVAGDDARSAAFVHRRDLDTYPLSVDVRAMIARAFARIAQEHTV